MRFTPLRIALIYLVFSFIWITTTDWLIEVLVEENDLITRIQMIKGGIYVTATSFFLYLMMKNYEKTLKREQELHRRIIQTIPVMITVYRPDLSSVSVNREFEKVTGWSNSELSAINIMDKVYPDQEYQREVREFMNNIGSGWKDIEMVTRDGRKIQTTWTNIRLSDETQIGIGLDIRERKMMEEQIEIERQRFEIAADLTSDVIWEWNPIKDQLWWGEGIESVLGYKKKDYINDNDFWKNHIAENDRDRVTQSIQNAEKSNDTFWTEEYDFIAADGSIKKIRDTAVIQRNEKGELTRIIGAMVDRTKEIEYREALYHERNRFEMIAKSTTDVLYEWHLQSGEIWWSEGWQTRFGYPEKDIELSFEWWSDKIHPEDKMRVISSTRKAIENNENHWSATYRFKNGQDKYSHVIDRGYFLKDKEGKNEYMVGTISDITDEVKTQEELRASEQQYRLLYKQSPIPMFIYDQETLKISSVNQAAIEKYGYSEDEFLNMTILDIRPEKDVEAVKRLISKSKNEIRAHGKDWVHLTKSGKELIVKITSSVINYRNKKQRLVIAHDISEQREAEERALSAIIEGEERERQRIAKELHDGLGQYLSASNMNLKSVYEDLENIPESLKSTFKTGLHFLDHAISETRSISQNLMPKAIQDYRLGMAVESLINQLRKTHDIHFYLYTNLEDVELGDKIQINFYRILQEALNNSVRHGKPNKIEVQLVYSEGELFMTIEDDGTGFKMNDIKGKGIGIRSMKTRVGAMSANMDIVSKAGKGTIVSVVAPVNKT